MLDDELRPRFVVRSPWGRAAVRLEARGAHQVGNALAALSVALCCGVPLDAAAAGPGRAPGCRPGAWSCTIRRAGRRCSTTPTTPIRRPWPPPSRPSAALPARRRVAVLGEMAELGARSRAEHEAVAALADRLGVELLAVGTDAYGVAPVGGIDEAVAALGPLGPGDAVLVKASRVAGPGAGCRPAAGRPTTSRRRQSRTDRQPAVGQARRCRSRRAR